MKRWGFAFLILALLVPVTGVAGVSAQEDNTLYIVSSNDIATLDPAIGYDLTAWLAEPLVYRGLIGYSETGELIPDSGRELCGQRGRSHLHVHAP
ncbi:MAG: hypothetical protein M5R40_26235 [Anaerolineae bacterium]|nr:hypothetical protein [Anaerolineae bacterium]